MAAGHRKKLSFRKRLSRAVLRLLDPPPPVKGPSTLLLSGKILVKDGFMPSEDFIALQRWAFQLDTPFTRKDRNWQQLLVRDFEENKSSRQWASDHADMPDEPRKFVELLRQSEIITESDIIHLGVYRWERLSGMGLHTDGHTDTAITFYLNDEWNADWGGDFTFYESKEDLAQGLGRSLSPAPNRLVVNHSTIDHKVNYCSTTAQDRITLQAFVYKGQETTD